MVAETSILLTDDGSTVERPNHSTHGFSDLSNQGSTSKRRRTIDSSYSNNPDRDTLSGQPSSFSPPSFRTRQSSDIQTSSTITEIYGPIDETDASRVHSRNNVFISTPSAWSDATSTHENHLTVQSAAGTVELHPLADVQEAYLLRYFVEEMAHWVSSMQMYISVGHQNTD